MLRRPRVIGMIVAAPLGAGVALLPGLATGTTPPSMASFTATDSGTLITDHAWQGDAGTGSTVTIAPQGTVTFQYLTSSFPNMHNVVFYLPGEQPTSCTQDMGTNSGSVPPLPHVPTGLGWHGSCTFNTAGTYHFYCGLHMSYMEGIVVVTSGTTTTGTTTTGTTTTTTGTTTTTTGTTTGTTTSTTPTTSPTGTTTGTTTTSPATPPGSPISGSTAHAIKVASRQHGTAVTGSVAISKAGAGGKLEVDVTASRLAVYTGGSDICSGPGSAPRSSASRCR